MNLSELRQQMDELDEQLVALIAQRYTLATNILHAKRGEGIPLHSPERETRILARATMFGIRAGLTPEFIQGLYYQLLAHPFRQFEPL